MNVIDLPLNQLTPAEYNPRTITREAFINLQESLDQFDLVEPLVVNKRDGKNVIVSGHQRLQAARELGMETVPCNVLELDLNHEKALNRRMNSRKSQGTDDLPALQEVLLSIDEEFRYLSGDTDEEIATLQDGYLNDLEDLQDDEKTKTDEELSFTISALRTKAETFGGDSIAFVDSLVQ